MRIASALSAELRSLLDLVGIPELGAAVRDLLTTCVAAVPSCSGVLVTSPALDPVAPSTWAKPSRRLDR